MPEAITKYAINSTLGTEDFKPLDQIFVGQKRFIVSDIPILKFEGKSLVNEFIDLGVFKPKIDGMIRIKVILANTNLNKYVSLSVLKDGVYLESKNSVNTQEFYLDINVVKNSDYIIQMNTEGTGLYVPRLEYVTINAQVTDYNYFDYEQL